VDYVLSERITAHIERYLSWSSAKAVMGCTKANVTLHAQFAKQQL
jgi:hypothetical protein